MEYKDAIIEQLAIVDEINKSNRKVIDLYSYHRLGMFIENCYKVGYDDERFLDLIFDQEFIKIIGEITGSDRTRLFKFYGEIREVGYAKAFLPF